MQVALCVVSLQVPDAIVKVGAKAAVEHRVIKNILISFFIGNPQVSYYLNKNRIIESPT